jgi:hypothetical protein
MDIFRQALARLADSLTDPYEAAGYALEPDPAATYRLPGAPPTGSHVLASGGSVWQRQNNPDSGDYSIWGAWLMVASPVGGYDPEPAVWKSWGELLELGPLVLLPETEHERALAVLYGPAGARWGNPYKECPYQECTLGTNHVGPHKDVDGLALGLTEADPDGKVHRAGITPHEASRVLCTCGTPAMHKPECPRFPRITGQQETTP